MSFIISNKQEWSQLVSRLVQALPKELGYNPPPADQYRNVAAQQTVGYKLRGEIFGAGKVSAR